jgi:hypothetical protein
MGLPLRWLPRLRWLSRLPWLPRLCRLRRLRWLLRIDRLLPPLLSGAARLHDTGDDLIGRARFIDPANSCVGMFLSARPRQTISAPIKKC